MQTLTVSEWSVDYVGGQVGALDGTIAFTVDGESFPFGGSFVYPASNEPNVSIRCR